jgi:beta-galactosidase
MIIHSILTSGFERDLSDMIERDRNHPSIFIWSIGNEVLEQWSDAAADTLSIEQANLILNFGHSASSLANDGKMSVNSLLTRRLAEIVKGLDTSRPVTAGCNEPNPNNHLFKSGALGHYRIQLSQ